MSKARELASLGNAYSDGALSNRNLIINGAMQVAQRGTSVSAAATQFLLDRFQWQTSAGPTVTLEQSVDAPSGFHNSLKVTVTTTDTMGAADYDAIYHPIEGLNASHLNFGTSNAQQFTLSFWAKASVTGTYAVNFINSGNDRTWTSSYSITSANTWEYKTITVDGDTSGTWLKTNGIGIKVWFSLGSGSNYNPASPSTAWASGLNLGLDGTVDLRTTNGATWQITGVQLEVGDTATPFEHRSYGQELALCQRFFCKSFPNDIPPQQGWNDFRQGAFTRYGGGGLHGNVMSFPVAMRAIPSITFYRPYFVSTDGAWGFYPNHWGSGGLAMSITGISTTRFMPETVGSVGTDGYSYIASGSWSADAEL